MACHGEMLHAFSYDDRASVNYNSGLSSAFWELTEAKATEQRIKMTGNYMFSSRTVDIYPEG